MVISQCGMVVTTDLLDLLDQLVLLGWQRWLAVNNSYPTFQAVGPKQPGSRAIEQHAGPRVACREKMGRGGENQEDESSHHVTALIHPQGLGSGCGCGTWSAQSVA